MSDLRLADLGVILGGIVTLGVIYVAFFTIVDHWSQIVAFVRYARKFGVIRVNFMSDSPEPLVPDGSEPLVPDPVPPHQDAVRTSSDIASGITTRGELLDILARVRVGKDYAFSANKIADALAGSPFAAARGVILTEIAAIRNGTPACRTVARPQVQAGEIEDIDPRGRIIRRDPHGQRYIVDTAGRHVPVE